MKNAVVVGATTHVGFALCQELIKHEVEVSGFEWSGNMDERAHEMLMEIGRNAFFQLRVDQPSDKSVGVVYYFLDRMERLDPSKQATILSFAKRAKKLIFISSYHTHRKNNEIRTMIKKEQMDSNCISIYLPMVIGPWQEEEEAVHKRLQEDANEIDRQPIAIAVSDVLYVSDVAKAIFDFSTNEGLQKEVLFKNENEEALPELMTILNLTLLKDANLESEEKSITEFVVKQSLTINESLKAQREQMRQKLKLE